jgi:hypothetical protein
MMNPIRNIEKAPGAGGPEASLAGKSGLGGYDPLRHQPHNYPVKRMSAGLRMPKPPKIKLQEGGGVDEPDSTDEPMPSAPDSQDLREPDDQLSPRDQKMKEIVVEAMAALRGEHPDPEKAIQAFIDAFGEQEFQELRRMVLTEHAEPDEDEAGGPPDNDEDDTGGAPGGAPGGMQVGGLLRGPGAGQDDQIEAATPGGRKVLLSDGEYVIDAPTVAALGDGSTDAGARRLDKFRQEVRRQAYGHEEQAKPMRKGGRAILEALNS